jgi:hypothetical protein
MALPHPFRTSRSAKKATTPNGDVGNFRDCATRTSMKSPDSLDFGAAAPGAPLRFNSRLALYPTHACHHHHPGGMAGRGTVDQGKRIGAIFQTVEPQLGPVSVERSYSIICHPRHAQFHLYPLQVHFRPVSPDGPGPCPVLRCPQDCLGSADAAAVHAPPDGPNTAG